MNICRVGVEAQAVGVEWCRFLVSQKDEAVAAEKFGRKNELLRRVEVIDPDGVAVHFVRRPELELFLGFALPYFRLFGGEPETLAAYSAFEL